MVVVFAMQFPHSVIFGGLCAAALGISCSVQAQEVVQQLPDPAAGQLAEAMQRLSRNPESVPALVDAGRASLQLDDYDAALGFLTRAQRLAPDDGRVLAGLALVALRDGDAITALQLFDNANLAGEPMAPYAADRALAFDLVGNNGRAQRLYRQALEREDSPEITRRLALSYAISGDRASSEQVLLPLLQREDRAAFRSRAFALAILGRDEEAVTIAETMLPPRLASRMAPYLRYMRRLTRAQQAAAANLGRFPAVSQIGQDDPRMAALGISQPSSGALASVDQRLIPTGEPLAQTAQAPQDVLGDEPQVEAVTQQAPEPVAMARAEPVVQAIPEPAPATARAADGELPPLLEPAVEQAIEAVQPEPEPQPSIELAQTQAVPAEPVSEPVPEAVIVAAVEQPQDPSAQVAAAEADVLPDLTGQELPDEPVDMAQAFAEFAEAETVPVAPAANAVDITAIEIRRERPEPAVAEPPPPPKHPSRQWVQVATGRDVSAFRFDWRRLQRNSDGLLEGKNAFHTSWGQTNRLLTGPFASEREAQQFVTDLGEAGVDAFRVVSQEGQEIKPL